MKLPKEIREKFGRAGKKGAKAYSATLTDQQKKKRASDAAKARWAKEKK